MGLLLRIGICFYALTAKTPSSPLKWKIWTFHISKYFPVFLFEFSNGLNLSDLSLLIFFFVNQDGSSTLNFLVICHLEINDRTS